jgi:hypothetical protein
LKGVEAPRWIAEGQTYLERKAELDARKKARGTEGKPE